MQIRCALVGMPGSGKSTVGRHLAQRLGVPFIDLDHQLEQVLKTSIRQFFEAEGEARFRDIEAQVLAEVTARPGGMVLSTGGGAVLRPENRQVLRDFVAPYAIWVAVLLAGTDTDDLTILSIGNRIGLRILQGNHRNLQITDCICRQIMVLGDDICEQRVIDLYIVSALLESNAEDLLAFHWIWNIVRINLNNVVHALLLFLQDSQCFIGIPWSNNAVRYFLLN